MESWTFACFGCWENILLSGKSGNKFPSYFICFKILAIAEWNLPVIKAWLFYVLNNKDFGEDFTNFSWGRLCLCVCLAEFLACFPQKNKCFVFFVLTRIFEYPFSLYCLLTSKFWPLCSLRTWWFFSQWAHLSLILDLKWK